MADRRAKLKSRSLERGKSAPLIVVSNNEDGKASSKKESSIACLASGHEFKKRSYYKPTYCHHCSELLWGIMSQGCQCTGINNNMLLLDNNNNKLCDMYIVTRIDKSYTQKHNYTCTVN